MIPLRWDSGRPVAPPTTSKSRVKIRTRRGLRGPIRDTGTTAHPRDADTVARIEDPSGGDVPQPGGQPPTGAVETGDTDQRSGDDPTEAGVRETSGTAGSIHESGDDTTTVRTKEDTGATHPQDHTMPMLVETGGGDMLQPGSDTASKEEGMREDNQAPGSSPMEIPKAQLLNYFTLLNLNIT